MDIGRMLSWTADRYPGRLAVGGPRPLTWRQWDARTNQLARALAEGLTGALHPEVFVNRFGSTEIYTFTIGLRRHLLTALPSWSRAPDSPAWACSRAPSW